MGSKLHCAKVNVEGIPMEGVVNSGANITIMGGTSLACQTLCRRGKGLVASRTRSCAGGMQ